MSDLLSPLLVTMMDEAHAYVCFCALMQRLKKNFMVDGQAMTKMFQHLSEGKTASKFFTYVTKTRANSSTYSRKPGNYNGTIIFEIDIMKKSTTINLNLCQT